MKIAKNTVVSVAYKLSDAQGNLIEESDEPMVYLHGGYDGTFPKIEEELDGHEAGFETQIQLEPQDAFGEYDPDLVKIQPRNRFPEPLEVGMQFEGTPEEGDEDLDSLVYVVTDVAEDKVVLDGNHPLAGMALRFALVILTVRAATEVALGSRIFHGQEATGTCAGCHGTNGKGSPIGPDLTSGKWLCGDGSMAAITRTITEGVAQPKKYRSPMPPLGGAQLSAPEMAAVAAYVWAIGHEGGR